jgi:hypothetical protein
MPYIILFGLFFKEVQSELVEMLVSLVLYGAKANEVNQIYMIAALASISSLFLCFLTF